MQEPKVLNKVWIPGDVERFGVVKKSHSGIQKRTTSDKGDLRPNRKHIIPLNVDKSGGNNVKTVDVIP